jgi:hypothetical protein
VDRRWAIRIDVRPDVALSKAFMILLSVMESRDEVASSKTFTNDYLNLLSINSVKNYATFLSKLGKHWEKELSK